MNSVSDPGVKHYVLGTHRTATPSDTLKRVGGHLTSMGITRVANITGLDRLGIPVFTACRPNARSISLSQGKGLEKDSARASAVMEAIETWHAEHIRQPVRLGSRDELVRELPLVDVERLPFSSTRRYHAAVPIHWIEGRTWPAGEPVWLPLEVVSADYTLPLLPGAGCFAANTNGLASGNTLLEAIAHGLYEVIERDAVSLWKQPSSIRHLRGIDPASVDDPHCQRLLDAFEHADIDIRIWDTTSDVGVATFVCLATGRAADDSDPEYGSGCHPAREIALMRALTEAAQARTTFIAGSRDDFDAFLYTRPARARRRRYCLDEAALHRPARSFADVPTHLGETIRSDLEWTRERLGRAGLHDIAVVDLSHQRFAIPVVKVVVPGLEGPRDHEQGDYVPGERARRLPALPV